MDRPEIIPEIGPGLTTKAPMVREAIEKKSGAKGEAPKVTEPPVTLSRSAPSRKVMRPQSPCPIRP